jgi:hypothetical protein
VPFLAAADNSLLLSLPLLTIKGKSFAKNLKNIIESQNIKQYSYKTRKGCSLHN